MSRTPSSPAARSAKAHSELLQKGLLLAFIGLAVLLSPVFMAPSGLRDVIASSAVVGWFGLVLGGAFLALYVMRRYKAEKS